MIAQACLETRYGNSELSNSPYYNLFGVKGEYDGEYVIFPTYEYYNGEKITVQAKFRKYPSYKESLQDYVNLFTEAKYNFYEDAWKSNTENYKEATRVLTGHYATDINYHNLLNSIIEKYGLTKFDGPPENLIFTEEIKALDYSNYFEKEIKEDIHKLSILSYLEFEFSEELEEIKFEQKEIDLGILKGE